MRQSLSKHMAMAKMAELRHREEESDAEQQTRIENTTQQLNPGASLFP